MADPNAGDDVEGLVYAISPDWKREAVIGIAPRRRVYELDELLRTSPLAVWTSARWRDSSSALWKGAGMGWGKIGT
jgi:hypothetical protein